MYRKRTWPYVFGILFLLTIAGVISTTYSKKQSEEPSNISSNHKPKILLQEENDITRLYGKSRYDTAIEISKQGFTRADTVVIARGDDFPDALAGTPLAYRLEAPILLTRPATLYSGVQEEIQRLGARNAVILGGTAAVSEEVENQLKKLGMMTERIAGKSRFQTAEKIAGRVGYDSEKAILTNGFNFPDALAVAPYAARNKYPILLTNTDKIPDSTLSYLLRYEEIIGIGGKLAVSDHVLHSFLFSKRISGKNRFETAQQIVKTFGNGDTGEAYFATGYHFADALTGSVLAAKQKAPLLLTGPKDIPESLFSLIKDQRLTNITLIGGEGAISSNAQNQLQNIIGDTRIQPHYFSSAENFSEGLAAVALGSSPLKWGVINKQGKFIVKPEYDEIWPYKAGRTLAVKDGKYYLLDDLGNVVTSFSGYVERINENYFIDRNRIYDRDGRNTFTEDELYEIPEEYMMRRTYDSTTKKYGYENLAGGPQIEKKYDHAMGISNGLLAVKLDGKWGFINRKDEVVIPFQFDDVHRFSEGLAFARVDKKWGWIDTSGNWVVQPTFDDVLYRGFSEGLAAVGTPTQKKYVDINGNVAIDLDISDGERFNNGYAIIRQGEKSGVIDKSGNIIVPITYTVIEDLNNGLFLTGIGYSGGCCSWGLYNNKGEKLLDAQYETIGQLSEGRVRFGNSAEGKGFIDIAGNIIIPQQYDRASEFSDGLAAVEKNGKFGFIDINGNEFLDFKFDYAGPFSEGLAVVKQNGKIYYINKSGNPF